MPKKCKRSMNYIPDFPASGGGAVRRWAQTRLGDLADDASAAVDLQPRLGIRFQPVIWEQGVEFIDDTSVESRLVAHQLDQWTRMILEHPQIIQRTVHAFQPGSGTIVECDLFTRLSQHG